MDVEKFNKQLKTKVALAKSSEKRNNITSAIKIWLEVTEMTLNFSKSRNIDASFKNMLINRTKGIFNHIKSLKARQREKTVFEEEIFIKEEESQESPNDEENGDREIIFNKTVVEINNHEQSFNNDKNSFTKLSELKNLPNGFKEIQPKDFKIITPHDENFVKKNLHQKQDSELLEKKDKSNTSQERIDFKHNESNKFVCFACGYDKNPKNAKVCKSCGTELD